MHVARTQAAKRQELEAVGWATNLLPVAPRLELEDENAWLRQRIHDLEDRRAIKPNTKREKGEEGEGRRLRPVQGQKRQKETVEKEEPFKFSKYRKEKKEEEKHGGRALPAWEVTMRMRREMRERPLKRSTSRVKVRRGCSEEQRWTHLQR